MNTDDLERTSRDENEAMRRGDRESKSTVSSDRSAEHTRAGDSNRPLRSEADLHTHRSDNKQGTKLLRSIDL